MLFTRRGGGLERRSDGSTLYMATRRPAIHGRSILVDNRKLHVRGVTYGTFRGPEGMPFPSPATVRRDFAAMAEAGANAVRTYVPPPIWLLDAAGEEGLNVMAGLAWEQHVAFLDEPELATKIAAKVGRQVRECEGHPAILCYAVGNEIPAPIVRWHGKGKVEKFLERLHWEAKTADPDGLVTYVNYPSTEYLELPFLDLSAFNVFLEEEATFEAYLARLQNLSGDRPLLITEVGIDSRRHGHEAQAEALRWQVGHAFATGAAGVFVFSWTDEWHRGGHDVTDWDFGLVDRERRPKPALASVRDAFDAAPFPPAGPWPRVSVVVCTHNGAERLAECLDGVRGLDYPDFETIVVDDGSSDGSAEIARARRATVVEIDHSGLSAARNAGIERSSGEIVAFLDDDAFPDRDWLRYVAAFLGANRHPGVGGPNLPPEDGLVADCVAAAPGGPIHVLISDREAEHVPGCNMAFRKAALEEIGGFDERFEVAGDDVDICWRLQESGRTLGFSAGAVVMHRRRDSVRGYLKQQYGYGKAEALLERKWPSRYNRAGASRWSGRIYEQPSAGTSGRRAMVRYGTWGSGLFQSIYEPAPGILSSFLLSPEFLLAIAALGWISAFGLLWAPLLVALPPFAAGMSALLWRAVRSGWGANPPAPGRSRVDTFLRRSLTATLFLLQPVARLAGRLRNGLSPWRRRLRPGAAWPRPRTVHVWSERWYDPQARIQALEDALSAKGAFVRSGGPFDRWDLDLRAGRLGSVRIRTAVEEHGAGRQLMRVKIWPRASVAGVGGSLFLALLCVYALLDGQLGIATIIGFAAVVAVALRVEGTATAMSLVLAELECMEGLGEVAEESEQLPDASGDPVAATMPQDALPPPPKEAAAAIMRQSAVGQGARWGPR
jgi:GT2 family glycosyltransferase